MAAAPTGRTSPTRLTAERVRRPDRRARMTPSGSSAVARRGARRGDPPQRGQGLGDPHPRWRVHHVEPCRLRAGRRMRAACRRTRRRRDSPMDCKPEVCWQLPLRLTHHLDEVEHSTHTLREWKRRDWGEGGAEFHWWCTEGPEAFVDGCRVGASHDARRDRGPGRRGGLSSASVEEIARSPRAGVPPPPLPTSRHDGPIARYSARSSHI